MGGSIYLPLRSVDHVYRRVPFEPILGVHTSLPREIHDRGAKGAYSPLSSACCNLCVLNTGLAQRHHAHREKTTHQGEKKGSISAMLGSKGGVKRVAVLGLGKQDKEGAPLTAATLEAVGAQVGVGA